MIAALSQAVALFFGAWLIGVSLFMVFAPRRALRALSAMGGSGLIHFGELGLRTVAGLALFFVASSSKAPALIGAVGWFLAASALLIMVAPRRWHATYSNYWAKRIPITAVRLFAPVSTIAGGALIWAMT